MLIAAKLLVLANEKNSRIIVSCNTKTIAIITKLIRSSIINQKATINHFEVAKQKNNLLNKIAYIKKNLPK